MITHPPLVMDVSGSETRGQPCWCPSLQAIKNLSGLIIAQGVFGLSSHSAACIAQVFFFFWQTGNSTSNFYDNYDLLAFTPGKKKKTLIFI